ncbi:FAD-dependent monooxygenase [Nostocaceae cyanobacterium CENA357]|uniref:FAD-dependent monooxygenase n=1 Tax=Atlanticothrix silvestris CENA357 TaxID=1725252 RepID=A0A8J7KYL9_9CYAN|nr:NAD(P)/FAD-dependent oxidoreductase [Atlanticothrix silvestris]MBH8551126.1 FAD-dependent monooxygenase [Atlanticothrix silvestris CENA357]
MSTDTSNPVASSASPVEIYDVVVVGAGPIGLATAIGLRKRGIENILVIDQTRAFRQVGQILDLLPNGLKAIKYLDPNAYEEVKKNAINFLNPPQPNYEKSVNIAPDKSPPKTSRQWVYKNLQGQPIRSIPLDFDDWFRDYGEGRVSILWYVLQTTLRHLLPQDKVKANHRCINVVDEPENGCVRIDCVSDTTIEANPYAYWADGQKQNDMQSQILDTAPQESATKSFRAKLIVAADGINSTIRKILYKDSPYHDFAKPEYSGFAAIACREITNISNELQTEIKEKFLQDSSIVTISNDETSRDPACTQDTRMMLFRRPADQLGYVLHLVLPLEILEGKSGSSLIQLAVQELEKASFPDVLKQLVSISPPAKVEQRPYYIHHAVNQSAWSAGRIVLVGDAAHGMPPFMAQGANQGFEDALVVATLIAKIAEDNKWDDTLTLAKTFEKYEHLRRPLMAYVQQITLKRFPYSSDRDWQEYGKQVYCRNFEQMLKALI